MGATGTDTDTGTGSTGGLIPCEGLGAAGLLLHTTLDDAASVTTPAVGAGMGQSQTTPVDDYVPARSDNGIQIDADNEYVRFPQTANGNDNVDLNAGTVDFCYQPGYNHTDDINHAIFSTSGFGNGGLRMRKAAGNNNNSLQLLALDNNGGFMEIAIPPGAYSFTAGTWVRITASWDFGVMQGEQNMRVYVDGAEVIAPNPPTGPANMPGPDGNEFVYLGAFDPLDPPWNATGVIDDFKLYDSALTP